MNNLDYKIRLEKKEDDGRIIPIATMGPICIAPEFKRQGWGKNLAGLFA